MSSSSSKSYTVNGSSKYGSIDPLPKPETIRSTNDDESGNLSPSQQMPKPAVRQRIQSRIHSPQIATVTPNSESASTGDTPTPTNGGLVGGYKNAAFQSTENDPESIRINVNNANINSSSKNAPYLPLPTDFSPKTKSSGEDNNSRTSDEINHNPTRPYPKKVLFIIGNEFCERFSYYGLRTILTLYFSSVLGFSYSISTVSFHLFATLCYLTPILGAILGDSIWGKFKTILYLSIVYLIGEVVLVASSIFWQEGALSVSATFVGLLLIGIGTGGIKPCVSALGGDQFYENEDRWRQNFFSLFYGAINLGSLISMFLTPMLRSQYSCVGRSDCYPFAFGVPCILMFIGIVVFLMARNQYVNVPLPERNVIVAFSHCTYLALKRKLFGQRPEFSDKPIVKMHRNNSQSDSSASDSSLAESSRDPNDGTIATIVPLAGEESTDAKLNQVSSPDHSLPLVWNDAKSPNRKKRRPRSSHWLYLSSDQYDRNSIEDFRSVWNIMLIFAPTCIYWCLYDQQGSLWTLQATRMDGRIFNTGFTLQPDQIGVANPLILLAAIAVFQMVVYPSLNKFNILTRPIQRMTVGGLLAALTFVVSAMIELRIQEYTPSPVPPEGRANLLVINGLLNCNIVNPTISPTGGASLISAQIGMPSGLNSTIQNSIDVVQSSAGSSIPNFIIPLATKSMEIQANNPVQPLDGYKISFKLSDPSVTTNQPTQQSHMLGNLTVGSCPLNQQMDNELNLGSVPNQSSRMVYVGQGNGKLTYKLFPNPLELPKAGTARVQLIYDSFGTLVQATQRQFYLTRQSTSASQQNPPTNLQFESAARDGQVVLSHHLDVPVSGAGEMFSLRTSDNLISANQGGSFLIKPGTRNLIVIHQTDASNFEVKHELLQDNDYRISILYQLVPYLLISVSEVMFSITGLEFSYASAPSNMKSVILGAWSLMTAFGNLLTVLIESAHLFSNIAHDFLFYAAIMFIDMVIFAYIGHMYKPYKRQVD